MPGRWSLRSIVSGGWRRSGGARSPLLAWDPARNRQPPAEFQTSPSSRCLVCRIRNQLEDLRVLTRQPLDQRLLLWGQWDLDWLDWVGHVALLYGAAALGRWRRLGTVSRIRRRCIYRRKFAMAGGGSSPDCYAETG